MPDERRAAAAVAAACVGAGGLVVLLGQAPACTLHNCDPTSSTFDLGTQGTRIDAGGGEVHLASSAFDGTWLDYPGGLTITVTYPAGFTPDPATAPTVWVSTGAAQDAGAIATSAAGQLDELSDISPTGFKLNNAACAEYYIWFSVTGTMTGGVAQSGVDASP